jgi:hypothetical protein
MQCRPPGPTGLPVSGIGSGADDVPESSRRNGRAVPRATSTDVGRKGC